MPEPESTEVIMRHPNLAAALAAFQAERPTLAATSEADVQGKEGKRGYKYKYAELADVEEVALPLLGAHGLAFCSTTTIHANGAFVLVCSLMHESGESRESVFPLPNASNPQALGSAMTYFDRYALMKMVGLAARGDDDDGATAQAAGQRRQQGEDTQRSVVRELERPAQRPGTRQYSADDAAGQIFDVPLDRLGEVWESIEIGGYFGTKPSAHRAKAISELLKPMEIPPGSVPGKHITMATGTLTNIICFRLILAAWTAEAFKSESMAGDAVKAYADLTRRQPNFAKMKLYDGRSIGDYVTVIDGMLDRERNSDPEQNDTPPWVTSADPPYGKHDVAPDIGGYDADDAEDNDTGRRTVEPWDHPDSTIPEGDRPAVLEGT